MLCIFGFNSIQAQYTLSGTPAMVILPSIILMDIEPGSGAISLVITQPTEAGLPILASSATDNSKWLNYTSANVANSSRKIMVQIASGTVPAGTALDLSVAAYSGGGAGGTFGTPNSTIQLSNSAQNLITGISSCYTGDGSNNGHQLTYSLRIIDYASVKTIIATTVVINFTFMDN
ncbi:MAG: hypothetical protein ACKVQB_09245 [Bacteroidia bacterium]